MTTTNNTGKFVHLSRYSHIEAFHSLGTSEIEVIENAEMLAQINRGKDYNVVRISENKESISFLYYPGFFDQPFPQLNTSWRVELSGAQQVRKRSYADSLNPPILHRKELLLPPDHKEIPKFQELTSTAESLGLFDDPSRIGFQKQWEKLINEKGYQLIGYEFIPIGNNLSEPEDESEFYSTDEVQRHLTALVRYGFSAPIQMLAKFGFLDGSRSVFDYGYGRGDDLRGLQENGIQALGWGPHYAPDKALHFILEETRVVTRVVDDQTALPYILRLMKNGLYFFICSFSSPLMNSRWIENSTVRCRARGFNAQIRYICRDLCSLPT